VPLQDAASHPRCDVSAGLAGENSDGEMMMHTKLAAAVAIGSLFALAAPINASTLFAATETAPGSITQTATLGMAFWFGYFDTQIHGGCNACVSAMASDGTPLGIYDVSTLSGPFAYLEQTIGGPTQSAIPMSGSYYEHLDGYGTFTIDQMFGPNVLLGGSSNYFGASIWATPGSNTATMEFDLDNFATSNVVALPSGPLYLDVTGTTTSPVTLTDLTPGATPDYWAFTDPLAIDFTITLSDTPFSPSGSGSNGGGPSVPEPWTWTVMLAGLFGLAMTRRARRQELG
jgi:hypothetical protein